MRMTKLLAASVMSPNSAWSPYPPSPT